MSRYRKLPVEIDAVRFNGDGFDEGPQWLKDAIVANEIHMVSGVPCIATTEGTMVASPGDYIIRGTKGELYPCKPDIFHSIYEQVSA